MLSNVILYYILNTRALLCCVLYVIMQIHKLCKLYTQNPEIRLYKQLKVFPRTILVWLAVHLEHSPRSPTSLWVLWIKWAFRRQEGPWDGCLLGPRTNPNLIINKVGSLSVRSWNSPGIEKEIRFEWFRTIFDQSIRCNPDHIPKSVRACFVTCCIKSMLCWIRNGFLAHELASLGTIGIQRGQFTRVSQKKKKILCTYF